MADAELERIVAQLGARMAGIEPIDGRVLLDFGDGSVIIEGQTVAAVAEPAEADCRISLTRSALDEILQGRRDGFEMFMAGEISTEGDVSVAVQLQPLLSQGPGAATS